MTSKNINEITPNDILLYSQIVSLFSHHQRGFLGQQIGAATATVNLQRKSIIRGLLQVLPLEDWGTPWKTKRKDRSQRGWRIPEERGPLNQISRPHMGSQKLLKDKYGAHICLH